MTLGSPSPDRLDDERDDDDEDDDDDDRSTRRAAHVYYYSIYTCAREDIDRRV